MGAERIVLAAQHRRRGRDRRQRRWSRCPSTSAALSGELAALTREVNVIGDDVKSLADDVATLADSLTAGGRRGGCERYDDRARCRHFSSRSRAPRAASFGARTYCIDRCRRTHLVDATGTTFALLRSETEPSKRIATRTLGR